MRGVVLGASQLDVGPDGTVYVAIEDRILVLHDGVVEVLAGDGSVYILDVGNGAKPSSNQGVDPRLSLPLRGGGFPVLGDMYRGRALRGGLLETFAGH